MGNPIDKQRSVGVIVIVALAAVSSLTLLLWPKSQQSGMRFWTFNRVHQAVYQPAVDQWNQQAKSKAKQPVVKGERTAEQDDLAHEPITMQILDFDAQVRLTLSCFWAGTPVGDLMEVERSQVGHYFSGPLDQIGFADLTDRIHAEGLYEAFAPQSFSVWSSRGRIFGLPHDVTPVVLGYRADVFEKAGINPDDIQTWEDFTRLVGPLVQDEDGDGQPEQFALGMSLTHRNAIECLLLQAGGALFDEDGQPQLNKPEYAKVLSTLVTWCDGPNQIATDLVEFQQSSNQKLIDGQVICTVLPDWMTGVYKADMPQMHGQWRLMPLPAWEPGARRTSVWGGTMLAIAKDTPHFEDAWAFAKKLYLSEELAQSLFENNSIVSPIKAFWDKPFYQQPDPYYQDQKIGQLLISLIDQTPKRSGSPFRNTATIRMLLALTELRRHAEATNLWTVEALMPKAQILLDDAQKRIEEELQRNVFLRASDEQAAAFKDRSFDDQAERQTSTNVFTETFGTSLRQSSRQSSKLPSKQSPRQSDKPLAKRLKARL